MNKFHCLVFAGNHGVAKRNVSAYPPDVTKQMVKNFKNGGAAINQLCNLANIILNVIPIELENPTKDFSQEKAMKYDETLAAMQLGFNSVPKDCDLLILGEMGISNTTAATAISCALFDGSVKGWTGLGTGVSPPKIKNKISIIEAGLKLHGKKFDCVYEILSAFAGREMRCYSRISYSSKSIWNTCLIRWVYINSFWSSFNSFKRDMLDHCLISHMSSEPGQRNYFELKKRNCT